MLNVTCYFLSILVVGRLLGSLLELKGQSFSLGFPLLLLLGGLFFPDTASVLAVWLFIALLGAYFVFRFKRLRVDLQESLLVFRSHIPGLIYFVSYGILLAWQKPYLEIPSDPVGVHLYRIAEVLRPGVWSRALLFSNGANSTHLLGYVVDALAVKFSSLDRFDSILVLGFAKAMLLSFVIYKTAYRILGKSLWAVLSLFLAQTVMGTAGYSYFRYYTFAPSFLNMAMYVEMLPFIARLPYERWNWRKSLLLCMVFFACFMTHKQEALFFGTAVVLSLTCGCLQMSGAAYVLRNRLQVISVLFVCFGLLAFGIYTKKIIQSMPLALEEYHIYWSFGFFKVLRLNFHSSRLWATLNASLISCLSVIGIWGLSSLIRNHQMRGVPRMALSEFGFFGLLSVWPLVAAFFPPVSTFYSFFFYDSVFFRLLYAPPFFLLIPGILKNLFVGRRRWVKVVAGGGIAFAFLGLLVFDKETRLTHFLAKASDGGTPFGYKVEFQEIEKLSTRYTKPILSDTITEYSMPFFTGFRTSRCVNSRCWWPPLAMGYLREEEFFSALKEFSLVVFNGRTEYTKSDFAVHWSVDVRRLDRYYVKNFDKWVSDAEQRGWLRRLYEREKFVVYEVMGHL